MYRVSEVIIVEGRYDKNTVSQVVDATIISTEGFGIFNDAEKRELIKTLAEKRGLIILTDSDGAGFVIRNRIKGFVDPKYIKNAYIPDVYGKERRKKKTSAEGKLGVEGMPPDVIVEALKCCGATPGNGESGKKISKADMYALGLTGKADSAKMRNALKKAMNLPEHLSTDGLLRVLNALISLEELQELADSLTL